jgi:hypothetical protein
LFWALLGLAIAGAGWRLGLGSRSDPGSGVLVLGCGAFIATLGLVLTATHHTEAKRWADVRWDKVLGILLALAAYAAALPGLGFTLTTLLILLYLFKTAEDSGWRFAIVASALSTAAAYVLFRVGLGTQLPAGWLWGG